MILPSSRDINNGVYKCGFARSQEAYDNAVVNLFAALDKVNYCNSVICGLLLNDFLLKVEVILSERRYLVGNDLTEADIRLFTTLVRFDSVYVTHFKVGVSLIISRSSLVTVFHVLFSAIGNELWIISTCGVMFVTSIKQLV